jgi:hypothetical protein
LDQVEKTVSQVSGTAGKYHSGVGHTPHKEVPELVLEKPQNLSGISFSV